MDRVQSIAIIGAGTAGWLAAAALSRLISPSFCRILVIDPPQEETAAFSEAALPSFHRLNQLLGINEADLLRRTGGTFRLGARFDDWGATGDRYFHAFGSLGAKLEAVPFHHYWLKLHGMGEGMHFEDYSTAVVAAKLGRFAPPVADRSSVLSLYSYGYHFHAASLAAYLREYAGAHGVHRTDRRVAEVQLRSADGFVDGLLMDDGSRVRADLYIDCAGVRGMLCKALEIDYEDWSQWLPCDRYAAIATGGTDDPAMFSQSRAERLGWRRSVPLQNGVDRGFAYSSRMLSDDEAVATLLADHPGSAIAAPRLSHLTPGRPRKFWTKNCIALTGSGADPLEHTGLHLVQTGITRLLTLFPVSRHSPEDIEEYNRLTVLEHERIRDFLIAHYKCTQRRDSPFWDLCRDMPVPDTLRLKMELFRRCGRIAMLDEEHFGEDSWLTLFLGQNVQPMDYDPLADVLDVADVKAALSHMRALIADGVATMPTHARYLAQYGAAASVRGGE